MHEPYGHLGIQEWRTQSKIVQPSCSWKLRTLLYAVCRAKMLHGQAVRPSLRKIGGQARRCAVMMPNVHTVHRRYFCSVLLTAACMHKIS